MTRLTLKFLGRFEANVGSEPVTGFHSEKARALLAYLALEPHPHPRRALAALLWPDIGDRYALTNLRNTVYRLRQTLDAAAQGVSEQLLSVSRQTIQFNLDLTTVDVHRFLALLDKAEAHLQPDVASARSHVAALAEAATLYAGELLSGFGVTDAPAFEEWLLLHREIVQQRALVAFHALAGAYEESRDYGRALSVVNRLLALDPYREDSHRQIMRLLASMGQPEQALRQFEKMRLLLQIEMGVDPSEQTEALARQIASGDFTPEKRPQADRDEELTTDGGREKQSEPVGGRPAVHSPEDSLTSSISRTANQRSSALTSSAVVDLSEVPEPGPFFGRRRERNQIKEWIQGNGSRIVAVLGIGGMGKTSLIAHCARDLASEANGTPFDRILWRSLLNAPPLNELLPSLLFALSEQQMTDVPENADEQLRLFLSYLRKQRILLVLDNLESILTPERAGDYRRGYESYEQLVQTVATFDHGSCLLITSRERPHGYSSLEGDGYRVQSLQLHGLDASAGSELLRQRGLRDKGAENALLIERYSGNPLALKLVADTVEDFYDSDITEFLNQESLVFDDIRTVLEGQWARLSNLERELLTWLAANREPMSLQELRSVLVYTPQQRQLVEALRSLQRRSLIEKADVRRTGFGLQNVIIEFVTDILVERIHDELAAEEIDLLHRHALLNAHAKAYVRQSQARLILHPIVEQLVATFSQTELDAKFRHALDALREQPLIAPSYAGGNLLNLLLHWSGNSIIGYDFSGLKISQAHMQEATLRAVNFEGCDLTGSVFTDTFDVIYAVAFSHDGQLIAAGTSNGELRLLRPTDGQTERILKGHADAVWGVCFSPNGQLLASGSADGTIHLWEVDSGRVLSILRGHEAGIHCVCFSPDGETLASSSSDNTVRLWDIGKGETTSVLEGHTNWVQAVVFHPDGQVLASGGRDMTVRLWNVADAAATGSAPRCSVFNGHSNWVYCLAFSPDGRTLASGSEDQTVRLWSVNRSAGANEEQPGQVLHGHGGGVHTVAFHPEGKMLASGGGDQTVRLWDVNSSQTQHILRGHTKYVRSVAFSPDGQMLASGSWDQTVQLWDPDSGQLRRTFKGYTNWMISVAVSPDGKKVASGSADNIVRVWDILTGSIEQTLTGHGSWVWDVAFSPDGTLLASSSYDDTIRLWDVEKGRVQHVLQGHEKAAESVAFSPDGQLLAYGSLDQLVRLADVRSGEIRHALDGHSNWVLSVDFSPDGKILASSSSDRTLRLWDVGSVKAFRTLTGHDDGVQVVRFSPNGALLASGSWDRTVRLWDVATWEVRHVLAGHSNWIRAVAFSPDGKILASGSHDHTLRLWDVEAGTLLNVLRGHDNWLFSVSFTPDGATVVSASADGTIRLWDVGSGHCLQTWQPPGPYEGTNITAVTGITDAQREALKALGAVETPV